MINNKTVLLILFLVFTVSSCKNHDIMFDGKLDTSLNLKPVEVEQLLKKQNDTTKDLKPDNEAKIVWANPDKKDKTEYVLIYIHGFSASCKEGYPVNYNFAKRYGMNLFCARLAEHGLSGEAPLEKLTPENYFNSAKRAVELGRLLGDKVILMSTSTGGTLSLKLAADNPDLIDALILYSPNVDVVDKKAHLMSSKFGYFIGRVINGKMITYDDPPEVQKYWQSFYHLNGVRSMIILVEELMIPETFHNVKQPLFLGYYYKNEEEKDPTVSIEAMLDMFNELGTPPDKKVKVAFADAGCHPIASEIYNKNYKEVEIKTYEFAENILSLKPVGN
jgi:pimeloyl-ACP methyl ester carboxylesterase